MLVFLLLDQSARLVPGFLAIDYPSSDGESTGVYWIPLYEILEEHGFEVILVNARDVHNVRRMIETCYLCERQQLEATIRPRAKPAPLRKSQVLGQHPITSPMDHFTK
jgi:hypothetical protein